MNKAIFLTLSLLSFLPAIAMQQPYKPHYSWGYVGQKGDVQAERFNAQSPIDRQLLVAVTLGDSQAARNFIAQGASINAFNFYGKTVKEIAQNNGDDLMIEVLSQSAAPGQ